ncbi:MAG: hypothetical protein ACLQHS_16665 [Candidatus Limnocylindrales bacterium]
MTIWVPAPPRRADPDGASGARYSAHERALTLLLLGAAGALGVGVAARAADPTVGFSPTATLGALAAQLRVTGPATLALSGAMALELAAGAILMRALRRTPFPSWSDALLEGYAGAVVLDVLLLFGLGGEGLFRAPLLAGILGAVVLAGTRLRPIVRRRPVFRRPHLGRWPLVALVWCGPLILTLASPVVPFSDVLPNHVAPVEHLAVFGSFATLATSPSPSYGASRVFQGYVALLGSLAALTGLPATLAVAAFAVPLTLVCALAARRLAAVLFGPRAGYWALLVFPLSFTFARLTDARDSVTALPLAAALALLVRPAIRASPTRSARGADLPLVAALAATVLVHPLVGAFTAATVLLVSLTDPGRYMRRVVPALAGALVACLPQAAVMAGFAPVPAVGLVAFGAAITTTALLARLAQQLTSAGFVLRVPKVGRRTWPLAASALMVAALIVLVDRALLPTALGWLRLGFPVLFIGALIGLLGLLRSVPVGRSVLAASLGVGLDALVLVALVPGSSLDVQSLRYEVPKAVGYWLPWACVPVTAGVLAAVWRWRGPLPARLAIIGIFLAIALLPIGGAVPNTEQASHPVADTLAYDLHTAQRGYWQGYPDPRLVLDASGRALVAFLRGEEAAGRLAGSDRVLHVAQSHQEWASMPIGVFTGALETLVCADAAPSIFTIGGRLLPLADLTSELARGYRYVVLEPTGLPSATRAAIVEAGYRSVFANPRGEVFAAAGL